MAWFFSFFFISGFCGLLYEVVWLRLSMAQFGVTSALVSIVLSAFMAGLGLGSWGVGRLSRRLRSGTGVSALRLYAMIELLVGISAFVVPLELRAGRSLLRDVVLSSSLTYYLGSGTWLAVTLVPWCACMGATIPLGMAAIGSRYIDDTPRSFSYLYAANVAGAVAGATVPLFLIELLGFAGTLKVGAALNGLLAALAMVADTRTALDPRVLAAADAPPGSRRSKRKSRASLLLLLLLTGFTSMGMEVVWIRQLAPYLGTMVYAFGLVLATYLAATFVGSFIYRSWPAGRRSEGPVLWSLLGVCALFPLLAANPSLVQAFSSRWLRLAFGLGPVSALFGFATPMLVDRWSAGDPDRAGKAYAINILGCITGPLVAGFVLLPSVSGRWALALLSMPWLIIGLKPERAPPEARASGEPVWSRWLPWAAIALALLLISTAKSFEDRFPDGVVLRDSTATVVATRDKGRERLIVNGQGMTYLTPITKMMAHLPLASLDHPPARGLVICFGMGTTFRSMLSWGIPTTAVELVPSVPRVFGVFHDDGPRLLQSPLSHVVVDDGRRFLERTRETYDVIAIDPPPPLEAAGSSLLYSREMYAAVKARLVPGGILQQWLPLGDDVVQEAVAGALRVSFPHLRVYHAMEGTGLHFLASDRPIPERSAAELVRRMPATAVDDLMEWGPATSPERQLALTIDGLVARPSGTVSRTPPLEDDLPVNEYFLLRRLFSRP